MRYLNDQIKQLYNITDYDYQAWCIKNKKPLTYKSSMQSFLYKVRTNRLVRDQYGRLIVKKPRNKKGAKR